MGFLSAAMSGEMTSPELPDQLTEIYNLLCRSAMNKEYYGISLQKTQHLNNWLEIVIAVGTTGSGISALTIWSVEPFGKLIWAALASASAILAIVKPIIQLNKRTERLSRLYAGHSDNYSTLLVLVSRIRRHKGTIADLAGTFEAVESKFIQLSQEDDPRPNIKRLKHCEALVRERHPPELAWYPSG